MGSPLRTFVISKCSPLHRREAELKVKPSLESWYVGLMALWLSILFELRVTLGKRCLCMWKQCTRPIVPAHDSTRQKPHVAPDMSTM